MPPSPIVERFCHGCIESFPPLWYTVNVENWILTGMITVLTLSFLAFVALFVYLLWRFRAFYNECICFVTPPSENTQSMLANVVQAIVDSLAKQIAIQLKTTIMGIISGYSRSAQSSQTEAVEDAVAARMPAIAGIMDLFPGLKKKLVKNPLLLNFAIEKLSKKAPEKADGNGSSSFADGLRKYG